jgi:antirestriction protein ArdC
MGRIRWGDGGYAKEEDKRVIFTAAAHAQRAADYLHSLQPKQIEGGQVAA